MQKYEVTLDIIVRREITIVASAANEDDLKKQLVAGKYEGLIEDEAWSAYRMDLSEHESVDTELVSAVPMTDNEEEL